MRSGAPIIPAVLTSDSGEFARRLDFAVNQIKAVHLDVIDNDFVLGDSLPIEKWGRIKCRYSEAHLMVRRPMEYLERLKSVGVTRALVHTGSQFDLYELSRRARELDILLGFVVDLDTDLSHLSQFFGQTQYFQVMGVVPGATGRSQDSQTVPAVTYLSHVPKQRLTISVDGGVTRENLSGLKAAGAQYFVASTAIFGTTDWVANYQELMSVVEPAKVGL